MSQFDPKNPQDGEERQEDQGGMDSSPLNQNDGNDNEQNESFDNAEPIKETEEDHSSIETNLPVNGSEQKSGSQAKTASGLDENIAALISYIGGFVTGLIFFFLEKDNKYIRFHALQSIILTVAWLVIKFVLGYIPFIGWLLVFLLNGLVLAVWIVCMVKAYQKQPFKIPVIGDLADQYK